ncbi:hypothetical protein K1719_035841 [Acacia pycnantha]|nr:hypothetical protein K1719_035841 [Acacia pycnantha]
MFRTTGSGNLQGMAQCVGDLSAIECQDCLSNAIERLKVECGPVQWGHIYLAKCYARYSEGGDDSPDENNDTKGTDNSSGAVQPPFSSGGFQVMVRGPISVCPIPAAAPVSQKNPPRGDAPTIEEVEGCTCHIGDCTCNNGHFPPWNNCPLSICEL